MKQTARSILLIDGWHTELKPVRKKNPKGFVVTNESKNIILNPEDDSLINYIKIAKLIYNKVDVCFNITEGKHLFFAEDGSCYILKKGTDP